MSPKIFFKEVKQNRFSNRLISICVSVKEGSLLIMEQNTGVTTLWRMWVDTKRRIVSFHEEEGCQLLEFRSREMFLRCVDQYSGRQYRYQ